MAALARVKGVSFCPIKNNVFVKNLETGPSLTRGGLIIPDDNMSERGIKNRWAEVFAIGPEVDDLKVGDWILIKHGRWTLGIDLELENESVRVWRVEYPDSVVVASETDPRQTKPTDFRNTSIHDDMVG